MIKSVPVEKALGMPLAHDITEIRPREFKGAAFKRGHIVQCHDLEHLRRLGKEHLYVLEPEPDELHEDDAAKQLGEALCGTGVEWLGPPREGKVNIKASIDGLLKVEVDALFDFNSLGEVMCATRHSNTPVKRGQTVAATRAIPLLVKRSVVDRACSIAKQVDGVVKVLPFRRVRVGVIITGNEIYSGRVKDRFEPIIRQKVESYGGSVLDVLIAPDEEERIASCAVELIARGVDLIITTGGMSVDPDDRTRRALQKAGARDLIYGSAVLPGAMFMIAYLAGRPVLGVPACGIYHEATVFDLIYPRILTGELITRQQIAKLGHGGLCLHCNDCRFPACPFGKGT